MGCNYCNSTGVDSRNRCTCCGADVTAPIYRFARDSDICGCYCGKPVTYGEVFSEGGYDKYLKNTPISAWPSAFGRIQVRD